MRAELVANDYDRATSMSRQSEQSSPVSRRDATRLVEGLVLFFLLSLIGNVLGAALRYPDIGAALLFPPYAALTAALVVSARRDWIWYIAISVIAHFVTSWPQWPLSWVLLADVANIARALTAALLLNRLFGGAPRFDGINALAMFIASAVLVAPAVGATIGAANVLLHGAAPTYWRPWTAWFVSNALTGLTMLPAALMVFSVVTGTIRPRLNPRRIVEALLLAVGVVATCAVTLLGGLFLPVTLPVYVAFPVLIWAASRFGTSGASVTLTVITVAAAWGLDRGAGPFVAPVPEDNILAVQTFMLFTGGSALCLGAVAAGRMAMVDLYTALLTSIQDQVAIVNRNGRVIAVNESWRRFAERADVPAFHRVRNGDDYVALCQAAGGDTDGTAARVHAALRDVLSDLERRVEIEYDTRHGARPETFVISVEALERPEGGAVVTRSNVTARRQAHLELEEQRRELSHLARVAVLGQLSGAFAHELSQPLAAILANAQAARHALKHDTFDRALFAEIIDDIVADDRRASLVLQRLRTMLKRGDRQVQVITIKELIDEVLSLAHTELLSRRIDVHAVVEPGLPPLQGDRVQLQQVLLNLILNGCEAMSTSTSNRRLVVTVRGEAPQMLHVEIRDSGTGIASELLDRLFEPFVTTKPDGLGLGLSISRTIVAAHGGRLWAENSTDGGATLHCVLPAVGAVAIASAQESAVERLSV
jgi:signal transduction histidine kinase/integral membrane sensor domain MASE1